MRKSKARGEGGEEVLHAPSRDSPAACGEIEE